MTIPAAWETIALRGPPCGRFDDMATAAETYAVFLKVKTNTNVKNKKNKKVLRKRRHPINNIVHLNHEHRENRYDTLPWY